MLWVSAIMLDEDPPACRACRACRACQRRHPCILTDYYGREVDTSLARGPYTCSLPFAMVKLHRVSAGASYQPYENATHA